LRKIGLLRLCDPEAGESPSGSSLPLLIVTSLDKPRILGYIDDELMSREEMPTMTKSLQKEIRRAFFEVIGNVFYHSGSAIGAIVCGQVYPKANEIQVTFLDRGIGLAAKVRSCVDGIEGDGIAIEWALQRGTSTLATGTQSRGLGLYLLRQFVRANEGEFRIYANGAHLEQKPQGVYSGSLSPQLRGTLVDLRIKVRPDVEYGFPDDFGDAAETAR
jgi:anti-sigma regulatory factor (Ser/Thr protein kinase)